MSDKPLDLPDCLTVLLMNIPDATEHGHPQAVADLESAANDLNTILTPLREVLSQPENLEHFAEFRGWLEENGPSTSELPAEVAALIALFNALENL